MVRPVPPTPRARIPCRTRPSRIERATTTRRSIVARDSQRVSRVQTRRTTRVSFLSPRSRRFPPSSAQISLTQFAPVVAPTHPQDAAQLEQCVAQIAELRPDLPYFDRDEVNIKWDQRLGEGGFCTAYRATWRGARMTPHAQLPRPPPSLCPYARLEKNSALPPTPPSALTYPRPIPRAGEEVCARVVDTSRVSCAVSEVATVEGAFATPSASETSNVLDTAHQSIKPAPDVTAVARESNDSKKLSPSPPPGFDPPTTRPSLTAPIRSPFPRRPPLDRRGRPRIRQRRASPRR